MLPPTPPPRINVPDFSYRPEPGSYGVAPVTAAIPAVSATSPKGGYPNIDNQMPWLSLLSRVRFYRNLRSIPFDSMARPDGTTIVRSVQQATAFETKMAKASLRCNLRLCRRGNYL